MQATSLRSLLWIATAVAVVGCSKKEPDSKPPATTPPAPTADKTTAPPTTPVPTDPGAEQGKAPMTPPVHGHGTPPTKPPGETTPPGTEPAGPVGSAKPADPAAGGAGTTTTSTSDPSYKLEVASPGPVGAGAQATLRVKVIPSSGYKVNKDYPTKLTIQPPEGVDIGKPVLVLADAETVSEHELTFAVGVTPKTAGTYQVGGTFKFAVCTADSCDPKKETLAFSVAAN